MSENSTKVNRVINIGAITDLGDPYVFLSPFWAFASRKFPRNMAQPICIPPITSRNIAPSIWIPPFSSRNTALPIWIPFPREIWPHLSGCLRFQREISSRLSGYWVHRAAGRCNAELQQVGMESRVDCELTDLIQSQVTKLVGGVCRRQCAVHSQPRRKVSAQCLCENNVW